jgi:hypothetical protein
MTREELTNKHLERLKENIQRSISDKGMTYTGGAAASLEVKDNQLLGNDYIYFLEYGRKPGKYPPVKPIRDWVRDKLGVADKEVNSVGFLVSRKIANIGTDIHTGARPNLGLEAMVEETLESLVKELGENEQIEILTFISEAHGTKSRHTSG